MSTFNDNPDRRVVPRWRPSRLTHLLGELEPLPTRAPTDLGRGDSFEKRLEEWRSEKTLPYALDLISAGLVLGRTEEVREAALTVVALSSGAPRAAQALARRALDLPEPDPSATAGMSEGGAEATIRRLRSELREFPRNPLSWTDLARAYTNLGLVTKAHDAMRQALALAPSSRFVVRSAARLYVHHHNDDEALRLLRRVEGTARDPWLLAAETAVSTIMGRDSGFSKQARQLLASPRIEAKHLSELASAVGTVALLSGKRRDARQLFSQALLAPTDNAIAQAEWATRRLPAFVLEAPTLKTPRTFEARAWERYLAGDWTASLDEAVGWLEDEPFSRGPAAMGTFVSSVLLQQYGRSAEIARRGLRANPDDGTLRNNLVFALASAGRLEDALKEAQRMQSKHLEQRSTQIAWTATQGLLLFRLGMVSEGRARYHAALDAADGSQRGYAAAYLAREEILSGSPNATSALQLAQSLSAELKHRPLEHLVGTLILTQVPTKQS